MASAGASRSRPPRSNGAAQTWPKRTPLRMASSPFWRAPAHRRSDGLRGTFKRLMACQEPLRQRTGCWVPYETGAREHVRPRWKEGAQLMNPPVTPSFFSHSATVTFRGYPWMLSRWEHVKHLKGHFSFPFPLPFDYTCFWQKTHNHGFFWQGRNLHDCRGFPALVFCCCCLVLILFHSFILQVAALPVSLPERW